MYDDTYLVASFILFLLLVYYSKDEWKMYVVTIIS